MPLKRTRFRDIIDFLVMIKGETEIRGTTAQFQREYQFRLGQLRAGISHDHDLKLIRQTTVLGRQAAAAFEAFKVWYASQR